jgi:hypothetical protein
VLWTTGIQLDWHMITMVSSIFVVNSSREHSVSLHLDRFCRVSRFPDTGYADDMSIPLWSGSGESLQRRTGLKL